MGFSTPKKWLKETEQEEQTKKKEDKEKKEEVPDSNESAQKKAEQETEKAKQKGDEKIKEKKEQKEKKKPVVLSICGRKITRIEEKEGVYVFTEQGKNKPIANLSVWIKEKMKDPKVQATIDTHLASYQSYFKKLEAGKRKKLIRKLNEASFSKIEYGKIDVYGKEVENPTQKAAYMASIVGSVADDGKTLSIQQEALKKIDHKRYLDYQHVLPPQVRTIIIKRGDKEFVCSRKIEVPEKGGRVSYTDITTGKRVYLRSSDNVQIVGTVAVESQEYKRAIKAEQTYARIRAKRGKTWEKDSNKVVDLTASKTTSKTASKGGLASSGSLGGGYEASGSSPSTPASNEPAPPSEKNTREMIGSLPSLVENPEEMNKHCSQETFNLPGNHLFEIGRAHV